jgi:hypothetical protein
LYFHGSAEVSWTERTDASDRRFNKTENYFEFRTFAFGDGSSFVDLNAGEHFFPFSFPLPATIPSSFSHEHGNVKYVLKVPFLS